MGISLVPINGGLVAPSRANRQPLTPEETHGVDAPDTAAPDPEDPLETEG